MIAKTLKEPFTDRYSATPSRPRKGPVPRLLLPSCVPYRPGSRSADRGNIDLMAHAVEDLANRVIRGVQCSLERVRPHRTKLDLGSNIEVIDAVAEIPVLAR